MTPPIQVGLTQHHKKGGRGRGLSHTSQGILAPEPMAILQTRTLQLRRRTITQLLVQWQGCSFDDATWEELLTFQQQFPHLEGKLF